MSACSWPKRWVPSCGIGEATGQIVETSDVRIDYRRRGASRAAEVAAARDVDLLVTPEMFVTGYVVGEGLPELAAQDFLTPVRDLARRLGMAIVLGGPELTDAGVYNAAWFVDRGCGGEPLPEVTLVR